MTLEEKYWAAGFLDGTNASPAYETKGKSRRAWKWDFAPPLNNDLLLFFKNNFGAKIVKIKQGQRYDISIRFTKTALVEIIKKIGPYLRARRKIFEEIAKSGIRLNPLVGGGELERGNVSIKFPPQEFDTKYQKYYGAGVLEASATPYIAFRGDKKAKFGSTLQRTLRVSDVMEKLLNSMGVTYVNLGKKPQILKSEDIIKVLSYAKNEIRFRKELIDFVELVKEVSIPAGTLKIKTSKVRLSKEIKKQIEKEVINEIIDYYIKEAPDHDKLEVEPYLNHGFKNEIINGKKIKVKQCYEHYRVKKSYSKGNYLYKYFSAKEEAQAFAKKRDAEFRHENLAKIRFRDPKVISIIIRQYSKYVFPEHKASGKVAVTKEVNKRAKKYPVSEKVVYSRTNRYDDQAIRERNNRNRQLIEAYDRKINSYVFNESLIETGIDGKVISQQNKERKKWVKEDDRLTKEARSLVKEKTRSLASTFRHLKSIAKKQLAIIQVQFNALDRMEKNLNEVVSDEAMCRDCKKTKPKSKFNLNNDNHHGVCLYCKECISKKGKLRLQDPKVRERNRQYYLDHQEEIKAYTKEYSKTYIANKDDYDKYVDRTKIGSGEEFWNSSKDLKDFEITVHRGIGSYAKKFKLSKNDFFMHLEEEWRLLPPEIKDHYELPHELTAEEIFELRRKKLIEIDHIIPKAQIKRLVQDGHARGCEVHPHHGLNLRPLPKELNARRSASSTLFSYYPNYKKRIKRIHRAVFQKS
jgi:hypothetical protein